MLPQETIISRLRQLCQDDERVIAAMLYGSFALGEADIYSDVDCFLFFSDESHPTIEPAEWVSQIAPLELYYTNEFGNGAAIFDNLVRAEFHFDRVSDMGRLDQWRGAIWFPSLHPMLLLDRTGELAARLAPFIGAPPSRESAEQILALYNGFLNWMLFGSNVLARGEYARAMELLALIQDYLLRMARLHEGTTVHWLTPSRALEGELSPAAYQRFERCTAPLAPAALREAYAAAWEWGESLMTDLAERYTISLPSSLVTKLRQRVEEVTQ